MPAAAFDLSAPCAACVTWRATPDEARALAGTTGGLESLDVLVAVESAGDAGPVAAAARALAARGAAVSFDLPLESGPDIVDGLAPLATRVVLRLPGGAAPDDALVFAIRTRATAVRAAAPRAAIGLSGPAPLLRALAAGGIGPYVSFVVAPSLPDDGGGLEWWLSRDPAASLTELLAVTARAAGHRLLLPLREADFEQARRVAALAAALPAGLTSLDAVTVCAAGPSCTTPVFLHPGTLEAVAVVEGGTSLTVRPGATRALARALDRGTEQPLPLVARAGRTEIDARAFRGPIVLRLAGWRAGKRGSRRAWRSRRRVRSPSKRSSPPTRRRRRVRPFACGR